MEGGKSSTTVAVADAELEARLKRVIAENTVDYTHKYLILILVYMFLLLSIARYEFEFIPQGIIDVGMLVGMLGLCAAGITTFLNLELIAHLSDRDRFLKHRFRWKMAAPLLLLQPRAYPLMKQLLMKLADDDAEADLEKGKEEDEGSSLV